MELINKCNVSSGQCRACAFYQAQYHAEWGTRVVYDHSGNRVKHRVRRVYRLGGGTPCLMGNGTYPYYEVNDSWDYGCRPVACGSRDLMREHGRMEYRRELVCDDGITIRERTGVDEDSPTPGYRVIDCTKCLTPCDLDPFHCPLLFAAEATPRRYSRNIGGDVQPEGLVVRGVQTKPAGPGSAADKLPADSKRRWYTKRPGRKPSAVCLDYVPRCWLTANVVKHPGNFNSTGKLLVLYHLLIKLGRTAQARNLADNLKRTGTLTPDQQQMMNQRSRGLTAQLRSAAKWREQQERQQAPRTPFPNTEV